MWWWIGLLGCGGASRVAALEAELAEAKAEIAALEQRLAAVDPPEQGQHSDAATRAARRAELQQRLTERRRARELARLSEDPTEDPLLLLERPDLTPRQALADLEYAARLGRAVPHMGPEGTYDGFRISGIRRGTLFDRIGVKNGDILHAVNGMPLGSMPEAMQAYQALSKPEVKQLTLQLTRRGTAEALEVPLDEVPPPLPLDPPEPADDGAE